MPSADLPPITVVLELNVATSSKESLASVWVIPGFYDLDDEDTPYPEESDKAIRMVGPVARSTADEINQSLRKLLATLGFQVYDQFLTDD